MPASSTTVGATSSRLAFDLDRDRSRECRARRCREREASHEEAEDGANAYGSYPLPRGRRFLDGRRQVSWLPGLSSSAPSQSTWLQWLPPSDGACGKALARSQWRVRAGLAPTSLHHRPLIGPASVPRRGRRRPLGGRPVASGPMTVNLTRIYTKLGDGGETHLGDMSRVPKTHPRIEAYGGSTSSTPTSAGADAAGPARAARGVAAPIQNDLFDVGADLAVPHGGERARLRVDEGYTTWLEDACDEVNATLAPLKLRPAGRHARRRAPARLPHGLPPRGAPSDPGRRRQPGGRALPQPAVGPAVHPQPRGQRRRRAAVGAGRDHEGLGGGRRAVAACPPSQQRAPRSPARRARTSCARRRSPGSCGRASTTPTTAAAPPARRRAPARRRPAASPPRPRADSASGARSRDAEAGSARRSRRRGSRRRRRTGSASRA